MWWSWALTAIGVAGLFLVARKDWRGFALGVAAQMLWVAYAVATEQWGFIVSALVYGSVYGLGLYNWQLKREAPPEVEWLERVCACGDKCREHTNGGWGQCTKCPCTDGMY